MFDMTVAGDVFGKWMRGRMSGFVLCLFIFPVGFVRGYPGSEVPEPNPGALNPKAVRRTSERRSVEPLVVFDKD